MFRECNFHRFLGFYASFFFFFFLSIKCNVWKCRDQQGRPTYTTLTDKLWFLFLVCLFVCLFLFLFLFFVFVLLNFQSNLTSQRFIMPNFTLKCLKNNDFLGNFFFLRWKNAVFRDFPCFPVCTQFLWLSVFSVLAMHSTLIPCSALVCYSLIVM